jgi:hypothetical protein
MAVMTFAVGVTAATAAVHAPLLTSPALTSPVTIHWTPAVDAVPVDEARHGHGDGEGHGHGDDEGERGDGGTLALQAVVRAPGPCDAPAGVGRLVATFADATTSDFSDPVADGTYCYYVAVSDGSAVAISPGLTVIVNTQAPARVAASAVSAPPSAVAGPADKVAPPPPAALSVSFARKVAMRVPVTVRWTNPAAADLDRVELVINRKHAPRNVLDGRVIYRGLANSFVLAVRAGQGGHLALFAVDHSGNVSAPAHARVSLAALIPMRPLSGSSVHAAPVLSWEPRKGAAYYNLQVFRAGRRVLLAWPAGASYRLPVEILQPGTYVWFVWPALERTRSAPRFADLIGRATFVYAK